MLCIPASGLRAAPSMGGVRVARVRELYEFLEEALNDSLFGKLIFVARDINENESNVELMVP